MAPIKSNNPSKSYFNFFNKSGTDAVNPPPGPFSASGGTTTPAGITPGNGYRYHVFTSPGSLVVASGSANVEYLVVGGGGAGGGYYGGAGGGGGVRSNDPAGGPGGPSPTREPDYTVTVGTYPIVVGDGGTTTVYEGGGHSSFNDTNVNNLGKIRSEGGGAGGQGGGASYPGGHPGASGGGGGAGGGNTQTAGTGNRIIPGTANNYDGNNTPVPNQGFPGGAGGSSSGQYNAGGGGGAGGAGYAGDPNSLTNGSFGGPGKANPSFAAPHIAPEIPGSVRPRFNTDVGPTGLYAGGGGGHRGNQGSYGDRAGPGGGGGVGGPGNSPQGGEPGCDFTGGGGGGHSLNPTNASPYDGGGGGNGIVIIRYAV